MNGVHAIDVDTDKLCRIVGVWYRYSVRKRFVFPVGEVGVVVDTKVFVGIMVATFSRVDNFIDDFSKETVGVVVDDIRELWSAVEVT